MAVIGVLYMAVLVFDFLTLTQTTRYQQVFDLSFSGLSDGQFPDGSPFVLSDIASLAVVSRVYAANQIQDHGLSLTDLISALTVE
ncbi:MAG: hypothetical protein WEB07_02295, partial [Natronospirillum sp.]